MSVAAAERLIRRKWWVSLTLMLAGLALLTGMTVIADLAETRFQDLAEHGARVEGVVVAVTHSESGKYAGPMEVRFPVDGVDRVRTLGRDNTSPTVHVGDRVTIFYDRADPERIASPGVPDDPGGLTALGLVMGIPGIPLLPTGIVLFTAADRRTRAIRRSGWRSGVASQRRGDHKLVKITWTDDHGGVIHLQLVDEPTRTPVPPEITRGPVLVGGKGKSMVIASATSPVVQFAKERP